MMLVKLSMKMELLVGLILLVIICVYLINTHNHLRGLQWGWGSLILL